MHDLQGFKPGVLPVKYQSPREVYEKNDRIRALIKDVKKVPSGIQVVLSRTDENFVKSILELEVPEIQDNTIVVKSISREPGYRTKIAVASNKIDVDPVGACVGLKGVRIQNVIRELEGEKIDVLRYDEDPHVFIKNALSPAEVKHVVIKDAEKRGEAQGRAIGEARLAKLLQKLYELGRTEDVQKAVTNKSYRDNLMKEFAIQ